MQMHRLTWTSSAAAASCAAAARYLAGRHCRSQPMRHSKPMPINPDYPPSEVRHVDPADLPDDEILRLIGIANRTASRHADDDRVWVPREC